MWLKLLTVAVPEAEVWILMWSCLLIHPVLEWTWHQTANCGVVEMENVPWTAFALCPVWMAGWPVDLQQMC